MNSRKPLLLAPLLATCLLPVRAEIAPAPALPCFPGAYYRKAVSSQDIWSGIEGTITLPEFQPDPSRVNPKTSRHLDNASIYLGGRAGEQEIDAGVTWEVIKEPDGTVSRLGKAYRPFWRNEKWHSGPAVPDFYYYPGDTIRMRVETVEQGKLLLSIELLKRGKAGSAAAPDAGTTPTVAAAEPKGAPTLAAVSPDAITSLSVSFEASSFGPEKIQEFKRVNAIDQSGNEAKQVQPTKARVGSATWESVYLVRGRERVPMGSTRFTDMRCPSPNHFTVYSFGDSGERLAINGGAR